jgi:DHA1 family bicyclomycin/chloramphenicol resistance-like MFS transporter
MFLNRQTPPTILTLTLIAGLSALTMNIFLPSLPSMAKWYDAPYAQMQLSISLYMALSAVLQLFIGPISDRYGRRPVLLAALVLFLLATIGTITAPTAEIFLVFRMLQAVISAATLLPRAIVRDMVSGPAAASMIGYVTMGMSLVPMIGPVIGGYLDETFGWQANFSLLLIAGAGVLALTFWDLGETAPMQSDGLPAQFRRYPEVLRSPLFWGYSLIATLVAGCFFAYLGGAPYIGDRIFGLSPSWIGAFFALTAIGYMAGNFLSGRYSVRIGVDRMIFWGCLALITCFAMQLLALSAGVLTPFVFFGLTIFMGIGNGMCLPNANAGLLSAFGANLAGSASGLAGAQMLAGGAALAALSGHLLTDHTALPLILMGLVTALTALAVFLVLTRTKGQHRA